MKLTDFDALTFDCYGTLIDWESGCFSAAPKTDADSQDRKFANSIRMAARVSGLPS